MDKYLELLGNAAALLGIAMCLVAGVIRASGLFFVVGYQSITIFIAGIGVMVFACLVKVHILVLRSQRA